MHTGNPRKLGGDYLGIDVNIAARVAQKATAGEILASQTTVALLDPERVAARRKRTFSLAEARRASPTSWRSSRSSRADSRRY